MVESAERAGIESLDDFARKHLKNGREGWDIPHTLSVVYHGKELAEAAGLDVRVLEAAAYLHDTGYPSIEAMGGSAAIKDKKAYHMERGAVLAREFLERSENQARYTPKQRELIIRLVREHDRLDNLNPTDLYRVVMIEADTLGMIDYSRATPTLTRTDGIHFIESVKKKRAPLFQTSLGKARLTTILPQAEAFWLSLPE